MKQPPYIIQVLLFPFQVVIALFIVTGSEVISFVRDVIKLIKGKPL